MEERKRKTMNGKYSEQNRLKIQWMYKGSTRMTCLLFIDSLQQHRVYKWVRVRYNWLNQLSIWMISTPVNMDASTRLNMQEIAARSSSNCTLLAKKINMLILLYIERYKKLWNSHAWNAFDHWSSAQLGLTGS